MSQSKASQIESVKANLPLPEQPPVASDWNSSDARTVNVGSGGQASDLTHDGLGDSTLRSPATADTTGTERPTAGREAHDGLGGIPNDAVAREAKGKKGLEDTTGKDYGYPHESDPSSGLK